MPDPLEPLLGRTVVLVAHPDDEAVGCGALLLRMRAPLVVFATDGAPFDPYFWRRYGSRPAYGAVRKRELAAALRGIPSTFLAEGGGCRFTDQELFRNLPAAHGALLALLRRARPAALLTHAYEGGHPDHDACAFLCAAAARALRLPVWEMPLYHRSVDGVGVHQEFMAPNGAEIALQPTPQELERKRAMCNAYASQGEIVAHFDLQIERFRPHHRL